MLNNSTTGIPQLKSPRKQNRQAKKTKQSDEDRRLFAHASTPLHLLRLKVFWSEQFAILAK